VRTLRARWRAARSRDDGLTLVELCVAMVIAGAVAVMIATTTIQALRIQRDTTLREDDTTAAALAMEVLTKDVRQAIAQQVGGATVPAFSAATPTGLTLVTWVGADPVKVSYVLSGGVLTRSVQRADTAAAGARSTFAASGSSTTTTLARNVTSTALFAYVTSSAPNAPVAGVTGSVDLALVRAVAVDLTVDSDRSDRLPGTQLKNTVACLNL
jgi:type II secretory pathway pseudopilin PulG